MPNASPAEPAMLLAHRYHVAKELVDTERAFVENMKQLIEVFKTPLTRMLHTGKAKVQPTRSTSTPVMPTSSSAAAAASSSRRIGRSVTRTGSNSHNSANAPISAEPVQWGILSREEIANIFCNVDQIYLLNAEFLASLLGDFEGVSPGDGAAVHLGPTFSVFSHFFRIYASFCNDHEAAQILIGELSRHRPAFAGFLRAAALIAGGFDIQTYVVRPSSLLVCSLVVR